MKMVIYLFIEITYLADKSYDLKGVKREKMDRRIKKMWSLKGLS